MLGVWEINVEHGGHKQPADKCNQLFLMLMSQTENSRSQGVQRSPRGQ